MSSKRMPSQAIPVVWGWMLVGSVAACSAALVAVAAASVTYLRTLTQERAADEPVEVDASADSYTKVRISGVGRKMTLESVAPVPPENPHAPPARSTDERA